MKFSRAFVWVCVTSCAGGQSGTDQWDLGRRPAVDEVEPDAAAGTSSQGSPAVTGDGTTPGASREGSGSTDAGSSPVVIDGDGLPDCASTDINLSPTERAQASGTSRWSFSACVVAPDFAPLSGAVDLEFEGVVDSTTVMQIDGWRPEGGCFADDPSRLLVGVPIRAKVPPADASVGSALRFTTDEGSQVSVIFSAPGYCFNRDPSTERAAPWGDCPGWSYRIAPGKRIALTLTSRPSETAPEVTLELVNDVGDRELWLQQAPSVEALAIAGVSQADLGAAECATASSCEEREDQHEIEVDVAGERRTVGVGATTVIDDYYLLNANTTTAAADSCSAATAGSVVMSWPACVDLVQDVDGELDPAGYASCAGDYYPSRYVVTELPEACVAETYLDYDSQCEDDAACDGDTCDGFFCRRPSPCQTDAECAGGEACVCAGKYGAGDTVGLSGNLCLPAECRSADDCGGLPCAIGYDGFWVGSVQGLFCHTPDDECTTAADCPDGQYCRYGTTEQHWVCEGIGIP